jgi:RHS repeat-associated protein
VCTTGGPNSATLTVQASGSCSVAANQAGNDNYNAASQITVTISITVPAQLYFIHADHLGTPRAITKASDNTKVWEWKNDDPFGNNTPDENPSGANTTAFKYNLRFPGQYFDEETNTHYNYFRDYEPQTGRYIQSDPIGLMAGVNTYGYVGASPLMWSDPYGLMSKQACVNVCIAAGALGGGLLGRLVGGAAGAAAGSAVGSVVPVVGTVTGGTAGGAAGAQAGGRAGAAWGGLAGGIIGSTLCSDDDDFCYKRWEAEDRRCESWRNLGSRWVSACKVRAADRRSMCIANGGKPNPAEPPEWSPFRDFPR